MKRLLVVYATREGLTRRVAEHLAETLRRRGASVQVADASHFDPELELRSCGDAVIVAGSVHGGRHEPELIRFATLHRASLEQMPAAFISVSMSQAVVESTSTTPKQRQKAMTRIESAFALFQRRPVGHHAGSSR
jgi:menaquinone-dependent protoporphyrinogen oxidase